MKTYGDFLEIIREVIKIRVGSKYNHGTKSTANTRGDGFEWEDSPEGFDFWSSVLSEENEQVFFDKYPLTFTCGIDTKGIAKMDFTHKGDSIKRGTIMNANKFTYPYLCGYYMYMKHFQPSCSEQDNPFNIDYSKPDWWKILEEDDEVIVVGLINTLNDEWSSLKIGTILKVTNKDVFEIEKKNVLSALTTIVVVLISPITW